MGKPGDGSRFPSPAPRVRTVKQSAVRALQCLEVSCTLSRRVMTSSIGRPCGGATSLPRSGPEAEIKITAETAG